MSEFTKGEWCVDRDNRPGMEWNNHISSVAEPHKTICFMSHDNTPDNRESEANARLIAQSPNMYRKLEDLLDVLPDGEWSSTKQEIRELLSKARGESQ